MSYFKFKWGYLILKLIWSACRTWILVEGYVWFDQFFQQKWHLQSKMFAEAFFLLLLQIVCPLSMIYSLSPLFQVGSDINLHPSGIEIMLYEIYSEPRKVSGQERKLRRWSVIYVLFYSDFASRTFLCYTISLYTVYVTGS